MSRAPGSSLGFIGLGAMGAGMAGCLLRKGYPLKVFAREAPAVQALVDQGATAGASSADVGQGSAIVFLSLPDDAVVREVLFGDDGLVHGLAAGSTVVDTSTIAAASAREFAGALAARGIAFVDAPVSGGQQGAADGVLSCMVGGETAAVDACREALGAFCKSVLHVGGVGAGQVVKACNQVAVAGALLGVADAIALAQAECVDLAQMREALLGGAARSFSLEKHAPRIAAKQFTPGFRAVLMRKDLRLALQGAQGTGTVLPTAALAEQLLDALCESGRADWDWAALALQVQALSGKALPEHRESSAS